MQQNITFLYSPNRSNFACSIFVMFLRLVELFEFVILPNFLDFLQNITFYFLLISLIFNKKILLLFKDSGTIVRHRTFRFFSFSAKSTKSDSPMDANFPFEKFVVFPGFENDCLLPNWLFFKEFLKNPVSLRKKQLIGIVKSGGENQVLSIPQGVCPDPHMTL